MQEQVIAMLSTVEGREAAAAALTDGMLAPGTRATKEAKINTLLKFARAADFELFPLTPDTLGPILGAMKKAGYRSIETYLGEARLRHVQLLHPVSEPLKLFFKDAVRSAVRGRGPVKRAPVVVLETLVELRVQEEWSEQVAVAGGPAAPWDAFVVSCWWMLRGAEALALTCGQCSVGLGQGSKAELRLGATKMDIQGTGRRRCFSCICGESGRGRNELCPACALARLLRRGTDQDPPTERRLLVDPAGQHVTHAGLRKTWKLMLQAAEKLDDSGDPCEADVTEHTPRRAGAQFHARRGLALWQIQYLGRWGGNTVEVYVGEAFSDLRADWSLSSGDAPTTKRARLEYAQEVQLEEIQAKIRELAPLASDVQALKKELEDRREVAASRAAALCAEGDEYAALVEEATSEGTYRVTAATIMKLRAARAPVCVVNARSYMTHAVDLEALARAERSEWSAVCGWRFREADAVLAVGVPTGSCCSRPGCAARLEGYFVDGSDAGDSEEEKD